MIHIQHGIAKRIIAVIVAAFGLTFLSDVQAKQHNWLRSADPDVMTVITRGGERHEGLLLCATDSQLVLWCEQGRFDVEQLDESSQLLSYSEIELIEFEYLGILKKSRTISIRGDYEVFRLLIPWFRPRSQYSFFCPPEIKEWINKEATKLDARFTRPDTLMTPSPIYEIQQIEQPRVTKERTRFHGRIERFHLFYGLGPPERTPIKEIRSTFKSSGYSGWVSGFIWDTYYPYGGSKGGTKYLEGGYSITEHFRLSLGIQTTPSQYVKGLHGLTETLPKGAVYSAIISFVPQPLHPKLPLFIDREELVVGVGLCYQSAEINGNLQYGGPDGGMSINRKLIGPHLKVSLEYFITRNASFQFRYDWRFLPKMTVPARNYTYDLNAEEPTIKTVESHTVTRATTLFSIGLQVHL